MKLLFLKFNRIENLMKFFKFSRCVSRSQKICLPQNPCNQQKVINDYECTSYLVHRRTQIKMDTFVFAINNTSLRTVHNLKIVLEKSVSRDVQCFLNRTRQTIHDISWTVRQTITRYSQLVFIGNFKRNSSLYNVIQM